MTSVCLLLSLAAAPASATNERHFLLITTHGAPWWRADAQLYAQNGTRAYQWGSGEKHGGRVKWEFTWRGDKGWLDFYVASFDGLQDTSAAKTHLRLDRDYCVMITAGGHPRYTGDSVTGGCNAD